MLRNRVLGAHKLTVDTVVDRYLPSHAAGAGRDAVDAMLRDPTSPIEGYGGGGRQNVRLVSADAAVEYLERHGGDVPFGFN
mgnify:CR=1 FL=1